MFVDQKMPNLHTIHLKYNCFQQTAFLVLNKWALTVNLVQVTSQFYYPHPVPNQV